MLDSRRHIRQFLSDAYGVSLKFVFTSFFISLIFALAVTFLPTYTLSREALYTLFILLFAAALWITEAIPAFAVSLLVIALEIVLLGFPGFDFSTHSKEWEVYLAPWSSPLVFLFLAGFIMARAASKTHLDVWLAKKVLLFVGDKPANIISGILAITYILSMFISNTATAAMMLSIVTPLLTGLDSKDKFQKALLLSVVVGANLGGMATIIGTPPNAIAIGILKESAPSFVGWMLLAFVPSFVLVIILRFFILKLYPASESSIDLGLLNKPHSQDLESILPNWKKGVTIIIFLITIFLWLTGPLHHIPTTVVSFIPIIGFTLFGILDADDMTKLRWDVIILIIGGLSLGLAVSRSGLDSYIASFVSNGSFLVLLFAFTYIVIVISNFMSNTAATNIVLPIVVAIASTFDSHSSVTAAVAVALSASFAMSLPVSTPPNAIIYSSQKIESKDFLILGAIAGILGPILVIAWLEFVIKIL